MQLTLERRRTFRESNSPANINGIYKSKSNHTAEEIRADIPLSSCATEVKILLD